mmetsp:Transcript_4202/g.13067  ORF Transcript_4202/g.13067 Transcript_4202/m.13067 type:complete len:207 (-) Transcript_4202:86-706(-)
MRRLVRLGDQGREVAGAEDVAEGGGARFGQAAFLGGADEVAVEEVGVGGLGQVEVVDGGPGVEGRGARQPLRDLGRSLVLGRRPRPQLQRQLRRVVHDAVDADARERLEQFASVRGVQAPRGREHDGRAAVVEHVSEALQQRRVDRVPLPHGLRVQHPVHVQKQHLPCSRRSRAAPPKGNGTRRRRVRFLAAVRHRRRHRRHPHPA